MDKANPLNDPEDPQLRAANMDLAHLPRQKPWLRMAAACYAGALILAFAPTLFALALHAAGSELHSHILLIPFISAYLISLRRGQLPKDHFSSVGWGIVAISAGFIALAAARVSSSPLQPLSENDYLALMTLAFLCLLVAGAFFFLGRKWMATVAFPIAFLIFMIPMPDTMADALETASQYASAEAADLFFILSGTPFLREGRFFQLPNITLQVAQECSGIRSSWVLFITSLLASYMFLKSPWRRFVLVAFIIPLGVLRNGFRILVIGLLCVHLGPQMIGSVIHRRGGPLFFALSLIPLFLLLWWLRRGDSVPERASGAGDGNSLASQE
jgi:exosortase C (VPDSG-CTERM-specific)